VLEMQASDAAHSRSKQATVDITLDAAAPSASLELPGAEGWLPGAAVLVRGTALDGTQLTIEGQPVALDGRHNFIHTLTPRPGRALLVVRFQHPQLGVRYVLRRAAVRSRPGT
jgi:hypothetical protein